MADEFNNGTRSCHHGAIQLIQPVVSALFPPATIRSVPEVGVSEIVFEPRPGARQKRELLRYWSERERLRGTTLSQFRQQCSRKADGTVVYKPRRD